MSVTKAIITAAAPDQAQLPLQTVVDRSGNVRCALELLLDEVVSAGIEEVGLVICPGQEERYRQAVRGHSERLTFFEQSQPKGYADALRQARSLIDQHSFLHLVSDHLYISRESRSCAKQLIEVASQEECSVSAIQPTRENKLAHFGAVGGSPVARSPGLFEVHTVMEKPTPTVAEQHLIVAGQRAGHYLCLFGMHVLSPQIFDFIEQIMADSPEGKAGSLSTALHQLAKSERYLATTLNGVRYNIGEKYGLLLAQLAIALAGDDRDTVLTELVELVAKN